MSREDDYITIVRSHSTALWNAINALEGLQHEWTALDYSTTLDPGSGANEGIAPADVGSVVFDTTDAMRALLDAGHATNLAKLL